ncbi:MAG: hypothetical protein CMI67_26040 [Pelagibaca sp.]|nr:hypothetical protein [Pelagibaca sp.]|tara:strand:- start:79 stop:420 length:342 start_codon:yes stop_codon:yes gene_type:complete
MSVLERMGAKPPITLCQLFVFASGAGDQFVGNGAKVVGHGYEVFDPIIKAKFAASVGFVELEANVLDPVVVEASSDLKRPVVTKFDDFHGKRPSCSHAFSAPGDKAQARRGDA